MQKATANVRLTDIDRQIVRESWATWSGHGKPEGGSLEKFKRLTAEALPILKEKMRESAGRDVRSMELFAKYSEQLREEMGLNPDDIYPICQAIVTEVTAFAKGYDDSFVVESKDDTDSNN